MNDSHNDHDLHHLKYVSMINQVVWRLFTQAAPSIC